MEYMEGGTLATLIKRPEQIQGQALPLPDVYSIAIDICKGLQAPHNASPKIVH